jgi:hypothetical protein
MNQTLSVMNTYWFISDSGCADGTREGLHSMKRIAACTGEWRGHIVNADHLCAPGWAVCSHEDRKLLKEITWTDATEFGGCFAFNAAQDGGNCHECRDHLEKVCNHANSFNPDFSRKQHFYTFCQKLKCLWNSENICSYKLS